MRIGIAGYMGAGKSTCARAFESEHTLIIDADAQAKALMSRDCVLRRGLTEAFGEAVVIDGGVRFDALGRLAFVSAESLLKLNRVIHPPLVSLLERLVLDCGKPLCILDAALIPLWGAELWFDFCVWVGAPFDVRFERLRAKLVDGAGMPVPGSSGGLSSSRMDEAELCRRMRLQEEVMPVPDSSRWIKLSDNDCQGYILDRLGESEPYRSIAAAFPALALNRSVSEC